MRITNILICIVFLISSCKSIDVNSLCLTFVNERLSLNLPPHHILKKEVYEEGCIYYIYLNEGWMIITEGANMIFPLDSYSSQLYYSKGHSYQSGIKENSYWRKENLGKIRIYCMAYKARKSDIILFNRTCNSIKKHE